ncbi:MAG: hypothetical protein PHV39_03705 [Methanomicrobium sp.]|nr:hypothetical protein [Methanomicrobium sp.]
MDEGTLLEYRIQRLLFHKGYTTRRSLPLRTYFYPDEIDLTDIDVYAIKFDEEFNEIKTIVECKSGTSKNVKSFDRLIWLRGLMDYLKVSKGIFMKKGMSLSAKKFAFDNKIMPIDYSWLDLKEKEMNLSEDWRGSYSINYYEKMINYYKKIKKSPDNITPYYWFIKMKFWLLPPSIQIKEIMRGYKELTKKCNFENEYELWLLGESIILISIALLRFCGELYPLNKNERNEWIKIKLMEGMDVTIEQQEKRLNLIKLYIEHKIQEETGKKIYINEEELKVYPPDFTDNLIELINRLLSNPNYSILVPSFLDFIIHEYILNNKEIDLMELSQLFPKMDLDLLAKISKNVILFLDPAIKSNENMKKILML